MKVYKFLTPVESMQQEKKSAPSPRLIKIVRGRAPRD